MHTPEFPSCHTVTLPSDLDFVALTSEHIFLMWLHQTRVNSRRDGIFMVSPAQKYYVHQGRYEMWHTTPTPRRFNGIKQQLYRLIVKLFENFTHRQWEPRDSAPPKRSHKLMYSRQPSRLRVIAKACTPQTSRKTIHCPWCSRTATTGAHQKYVWPHGTSALRKDLGPPNELQHKLSACKLNHVRIFAGLVFTQHPWLLNMTVIRSG